MRTCSTAFNTTLALALALLTICGGEALARERGRAPLGKPTLRVIPRPRNTNTAGGVFGGRMMSQMNQAANAVVGRRSRGRSRTLSVDGMSFVKPVKMGEVVSIYTKVEKVGRSTMTVKVQAYKRHLYSDKQEKVTEAVFKVGAVTKKDRSRRIPTRKPTVLGRLADGVAGVAHGLRNRRHAGKAGSASGEPAIRIYAKQSEANGSGFMQTGLLMSQMDLAGTTAATAHSGGRVVTVAVNKGKFLRPVRTGDEVSVHARVKKVGRTSMDVQVETWTRGPTTDAMTKVNEALFKFVALDRENRPRPVPGL